MEPSTALLPVSRDARLRQARVEQFGLSMEERTLNFLDNWIDANITSASHEPDGDASTMQYRFLTDAVAAGLALEDVNAEWREAEIKIRKALEARRFKR
jgi:hypothetical protein